MLVVYLLVCKAESQSIINKMKSLNRIDCHKNVVQSSVKLTSWWNRIKSWLSIKDQRKAKYDHSIMNIIADYNRFVNKPKEARKPY